MSETCCEIQKKGKFNSQLSLEFCTASSILIRSRHLRCAVLIGGNVWRSTAAEGREESIAMLFLALFVSWQARPSSMLFEMDK